MGSALTPLPIPPRREQRYVSIFNGHAAGVSLQRVKLIRILFHNNFSSNFGFDRLPPCVSIAAFFYVATRSGIFFGVIIWRVKDIYLYLQHQFWTLDKIPEQIRGVYAARMATRPKKTVLLRYPTTFEGASK